MHTGVSELDNACRIIAFMAASTCSNFSEDSAISIEGDRFSDDVVNLALLQGLFGTLSKNQVMDVNLLYLGMFYGDMDIV